MKALPTLGAMVVAGAMALATTAPASATRLVFVPGPSNVLVNQDYGDNVTSELDGVFVYGPEGGFTPNVTVEYGPLGIRTFIGGYGDLTNVLWNGAASGDWVITLTAEKGFEVALEKFDLAAFSSGLMVDELTVDWGGGNQTFNDQLISDSGHNEFLFNPATVRGPSISITIIEAAGARGSIGLDNLVFSQVPAPGMSAAGFVGALVIMRRRRRS